MRYQNNVTIRLPVQDVFAYFTDIDRAPMWHSRDLDVQRRSGEPLCQGAELDVTAQVLGRTVRSGAAVTSWDPPHFVRVDRQGGIFQLSLEFVFQETDDGTWVTASTQVRVPGWMQRFVPVVGSVLQRQGQRGLEEVKMVLEGPGMEGAES